MNKFAKYSIIIGLALVFISIIFSAGNLNHLWESFDGLGNHSQNEHIVINDDIESLVINVRNMRVRIKGFSGDNIRINYRHDERNPISITEYDGVLSIQKEYNRNWQLFSLNFRIPELVIKVPSDLILYYNIASTNASINVNNLNILDSTFRTSNSSITLSNINTDYNLEVRSANGRINLDNLEAELIIAQSSNARINASNILAYDLSLTSSNGRISIQDIETEKVNITTSNSRIDFRNLDSNDIELRSSNGRIEGSIIGNREDFQKNIRTSNGRIMIDGENHGTIINDRIELDQIIRAQTSNGRIDLTFR